MVYLKPFYQLETPKIEKPDFFLTMRYIGDPCGLKSAFESPVTPNLASPTATAK
jgi:hypothetical protein